MTPQPSTAWRQQHCQISALHVKITNLGTVQVTQSTVRVQEVVTMMGVQKCQRLVTETRKTTKGRVAAPVGALGCLVVRLGNSTHQRSFAQHKAHHHHAVPVAVQVTGSTTVLDRGCPAHLQAPLALSISHPGTHAATMCSANVATCAH